VFCQKSANWRINYEAVLYDFGRSVQIVQADGQRLMFERPATKTAWSAPYELCTAADPADGQVRIERDAQGRTSYHWRWSDGRTLVFAAGQNGGHPLQSITAASGEQLTMTYAPSVDDQQPQRLSTVSVLPSPVPAQKTELRRPSAGGLSCGNLDRSGRLHMNRRSAVAAMLRPVLLMAVLIIFAMAGGKASAQCVDFPKEGIVGAVLDRPGSYCMKRDLVVEGTYNWLAWEGRSYHSASRYALVLGASDVVVDLGGKSVRSNAASLFGGVLGSVVSKPLVQSGSNWSDRVNSIDWSKANRNVTVKNGSIDLEFASYKADNNPFGILLATDREWYAFPETSETSPLLLLPSD
jgi:hypothetical protein